MPQPTTVAGAQVAQLAFAATIGAGILSTAAGQEAWAVRCAYAAAYAGVIALHLPGIAASNLARAHSRGLPRRAARQWENTRKLTLAGFWGPMAILVVAALDRRLGCSADTYAALRLLALIVMATGHMLFERAMASNQSYAGDVRAQTARCQALITGGPYRVVRHPGYLGMIICSLSTPPLLGSQWALIPAILTVGCFIALTALEDRDLQREFVGYQEYARQVHFRLLPGLW
jgi:protein-S-isoprenylcysteine O-methyltransferase Ste14